MKRVFVTGDTHGRFDFLPQFCEKYQTTTDDILIILGDAGINYYGGKKELYLKNHLNKQPITLFCIRGNHEDRPSARSSMQFAMNEVGCLSGKMYWEPDFPNICYAADGEVYSLNNKRLLTIGGAYSVDKFYRISMGWKWVPNEMLSRDEMDKISQIRGGQYYDYIMTHTCPYSWQPTDLFLQGLDQSLVDDTMERWLNGFEKTVKYGHWMFGHYHANRKNMYGMNVDMLFDEIVQIEGEVI